MKIEILDLAERDILDGFQFYESQTAGLGSYFLNGIYSDIESLRLFAGIHSKPHKNYHRLLSKRFPFAIYLYRCKPHGFRSRGSGLPAQSGLDSRKIG